MTTTPQRTVSGRSILAIIWGLLSLGLIGATIGVAFMEGPYQWVLLAFASLQFLFLFMSIAYTTGRTDQRLGLVRPPFSW